MDTILVELTLGPVKFQYSLMFIIFFLVGLLTVLFHSRDNFDQPTYEVAANEPASIMMPRFFSSSNLYLRGFLIYLAGMIAIYVALSLTGEALAKGVLAVFADPTMDAMVAPAAGTAPLYPVNGLWCWRLPWSGWHQKLLDCEPPNSCCAGSATGLP